MDDFTFNSERLWRICLRCVRIMDSPNEKDLTKYNIATAMLLFGTAAQESNLKWERQRSPRWEGTVGGFSKWQLEQGSIQNTREHWKKTKWMGRLQRAIKVVFNDPKAVGIWLTNCPMDQLLWAMRIEDNDHLGVVFAREHYYYRPQAIPVYEQSLLSPCQIKMLAEYWKQHYNTHLGAGTTAQFTKNFYKYCLDIIQNTTGLFGG